MPQFPGPLPNDVRPDLTVSTGPLTRERIAEVFMQIEEPAETLGNIIHDKLTDESNKPIKLSDLTAQERKVARVYLKIPHTRALHVSDDKNKNYKNTIGAFYHQISEKLTQLNDILGEKHLFIGDKNKQITNDEMAGVIQVFDLKTALDAMHTIVSEGEGASVTDIMDENQNLSHYWKFFQLYLGSRFYFDGIKDDSGGDPLQFAFNLGSKIDFNFKTDVYRDDAIYARGRESPENIYVKRFNMTYGNLLKSLERVLNGNKSELHSTAIPLMRQMQIDYLQAINPTYTKESIAPHFEPIFTVN